MAKFYVARKADGKEWVGAKIPVYSTKKAAGADFFAVEDTVIPCRGTQYDEICAVKKSDVFDDLSDSDKQLVANKFAPTLVHTGIKVELADDEALMLLNRSGSPRKGIVLANGVGLVDADYYGCKANDGEVMFAFYNVLPYDIVIKAGDRIGQGVIIKYSRAEGSSVGCERTGGFNSTGDR